MSSVATEATTPLGEPKFPSLLHYAVGVLSTHDHVQKASLTLEAHAQFHSGAIPIFVQPSTTSANDSSSHTFPKPPSKPNRPQHLEVRAPKDIPVAKKGVEHHEWNKMRLIHSLAHIESYAIDLSWDILVRFATPENEGTEQTEGVPMPKEFYIDWLRIAMEEAKHFTIWNTRLEELGYTYGSMPIHDGLWQSADETSHSLLARLAVVHAVHEARGLDQAPKMLQQLTTYGDKKSTKLLEIIEKDELTHVTSGLTWFKYICARSATPVEPISKFHEIVRQNFRGSLLPPFNTKARTECGFTEEWYLPLAVKKERPVADATPKQAGDSNSVASAPAPKVEEEKVQS